MANSELGQKQVCPNCQAKFYDLGRRPAHCPKCATDFDPEEALKLRNRRGRPAGYPADEGAEDQVKEKSAESDEDEEDETVKTPEIDEEGHEPILTPDDEDEPAVDPTEESGMGEASEDDDVLAEDDDDDSVPFIEDEDDDGFEGEIIKPKEDE